MRASTACTQYREALEGRVQTNPSEELAHGAQGRQGLEQRSQLKRMRGSGRGQPGVLDGRDSAPGGRVLACSNSPRATVDRGNAMMLMQNVGLLACTNSPRATVDHVDFLTSKPIHSSHTIVRSRAFTSEIGRAHV